METQGKIQPIPRKRYWLDSAKDVSGVYSPNYEGQSRWIDIKGDCGFYLKDSEGAIRFPDGCFTKITEV